VSSRILVVDYGIGNIRSVCRAFEKCGASVELSDDPSKIEAADRIVLPGVGAIAHCMDQLNQRGMTEPLTRYTEKERPFLGICVGMQMMMDESWEFTKSKCLGWHSGDVIEVPRKNAKGQCHKIPHVGWSNLDTPSTGIRREGTILQGIGNDEPVYFVHSFMVNPLDDNTRLADTRYNDINICAAVSSGAISGTQFHPEKSGAVGLRILENFMAL